MFSSTPPQLLKLTLTTSLLDAYLHQTHWCHRWNQQTAWRPRLYHTKYVVLRNYYQWCRVSKRCRRRSCDLQISNGHHTSFSSNNQQVLKMSVAVSKGSVMLIWTLMGSQAVLGGICLELWDQWSGFTSSLHLRLRLLWCACEHQATSGNPRDLQRPSFNLVMDLYVLGWRIFVYYSWWSCRSLFVIMVVLFLELREVCRAILDRFHFQV